MTKFRCISTPLYPGNGEPVEIHVETIDHVSGVSLLCKGFDISPKDWPDGFGISNEIVTLSTHQGTHIDAPMHYHPEGHDVASAPIENFMGNAVVFSDLEREGQSEVVFEWESYIGKLEKFKGRAKAVFFITGAWRRYGEKSYFEKFKGVPAKYVAAAIDRGYSLIGTDAFSLDPPFAVMSRKFIETRDPTVLWPAHVLGRTKPYYQIERLYDLEAFENSNLVEFIALPIKLRCGAAWTRAVAKVIE